MKNLIKRVVLLVAIFVVAGTNSIYAFAAPNKKESVVLLANAYDVENILVERIDDNSELILFTEDDAKFQCEKLEYSIKDNDGFSIPTLICDKPVKDKNVSSYRIDDKIYILYKEEDPVSGQSIKVNMSVFDCSLGKMSQEVNSFAAINNDIYKLIDTKTISTVSKVDDEYVIQIIPEENSKADTETLLTSKYMIDSFEATKVGNDFIVIYTIDKDNNLETTDDKEIYRIDSKTKVPVKITDSTGFKQVISKDKNSFYYYSDNNIYSIAFTENISNQWLDVSSTGDSFYQMSLYDGIPKIVSTKLKFNKVSDVIGIYFTNRNEGQDVAKTHLSIEDNEGYGEYNISYNPDETFTFLSLQGLKNKFNMFKYESYAIADCKTADYSNIKTAIENIPKYDADLYKEDLYQKILDVKDKIRPGIMKDEQEILDRYLEELSNAIENSYKDADYSKIDEMLKKIPIDLSIYTDNSVAALNEAKNSIIRGKDIREQKTVDGYAETLEKAIKNLEKKIIINEDKNETISKEDNESNVPSTGDDSITVLILCAGFSMAALIYLNRQRRKIG